MTAAAPPPVLLLTRPRPQAEGFADAARAACPPHQTVIAPLSEIAPLPFDPAALTGAAGLVLTSANAVPMLEGLPGLASLPAYCVGPGTAGAAQAAGLAARETGGDARRLIDWMRRHHPPGPLVHVHGRHLARDLVAALSDLGLSITGLPVYEARLIDWPPDILPSLAGRPVVAPLFSPRAAAALGRQPGVGDMPGLVPVAISAACAARLPPALRRRAMVAQAPDAAAMLQATGAALTQCGAGP